jgi:hypothetical protein
VNDGKQRTVTTTSNIDMYFEEHVDHLRCPTDLHDRTVRQSLNFSLMPR